MTQSEIESFLELYERFRYEDQLHYYLNRRREFRRARNQALTISIILTVLTALASAVETISVSWLQLPCLLIAAISPVLSSALIGYNALYGFEQQAKLYQDAASGLREAHKHRPHLSPDTDIASASVSLAQYVEAVEKVFHDERGQWGQLAPTLRPPEL